MSPSLKPYQQDGAAHLLRAFAEALRIDRVRLLLDEPGLGKTVTGAACLAMRDAINGEHRPAIVVCPSSVRATWRAELAKWAPDLTVILPDDVASIRAPGPGEVVVLGHDQLGCLRPPKAPPPTAPQKARDAYAKAKALHDKRAAAIDSLKRLAPHTDLVVDEAQYAKGAASARSLVLESLWKTGCRAVGGVLWILTGTIDPCSPLDLFVVLEVAGIANRIWPGGLVEFAAHFGGTYHSRGNRWDFPELPPGGSVLQGPVGERMARYVLLRRQEEVLGELPQPTSRVLLCPITGTLASLGDSILRAAVTCASDDPDLAAGLILDALSGRKASAFALDLSLLSELRAKLAEVKVAAMLARLAQLEAEGIGTTTAPIVVYSEHRAPSEALRGRPGWGFITGADARKQRQQTILDLEAGLLRGVAFTGAGRTGITLIAAAYMLKVSLSWSDADEQQAEKRILRYGQTRPVIIESIIADHPVEHLVLGVLARKAARAAATWARRYFRRCRSVWVADRRDVHMTPVLIIRRTFPAPVTFADLRRAALECLWPPFWGQPWASQRTRKADCAPVVMQWWHAAIKEATGALDEVYAVIDGREVRVATVDGPFEVTWVGDRIARVAHEAGDLLSKADEVGYWQCPHEVRLNMEAV